MSQVSLKTFRRNTKQYFEEAVDNPVLITRNSRVYILMTKEHYVDLIHKIKFPGLMEMPSGVHTIVQFHTSTVTSAVPTT